MLIWSAELYFLASFSSEDSAQQLKQNVSNEKNRQQKPHSVYLHVYFAGVISSHDRLCQPIDTRHRKKLRGEELTCTAGGKRKCTNSWRHPCCPCKERLRSASDSFNYFIRFQSFLFSFQRYLHGRPVPVFVNCSQCRSSLTVEPLTRKKERNERLSAVLPSEQEVEFVRPRG